MDCIRFKRDCQALFGYLTNPCAYYLVLAGFQRESAGRNDNILAVMASQPAMSASSNSLMASRPSARNSSSEAVRVSVTVSLDLVL